MSVKMAKLCEFEKWHILKLNLYCLENGNTQTSDLTIIEVIMIRKHFGANEQNKADHS